MKKILKLTAMLFGALAMIFNLSSCSKDDDGPDCCSWDETYTYDGDTYTYEYEICEDGTFSFTDGSTTTTGDWIESDYFDGLDWDDIESEYCN